MTGLIFVVHSSKVVGKREFRTHLSIQNGTNNIISTVYVNSLLATLNTRSALAGKGMENDESTEMTNASFHIGNVTQSIILDRQTSPRRRFDSIKKTEVSGASICS